MAFKTGGESNPEDPEAPAAVPAMSHQEHGPAGCWEDVHKPGSVAAAPRPPSPALPWDADLVYGVLRGAGVGSRLHKKSSSRWTRNEENEVSGASWGALSSAVTRLSPPANGPSWKGHRGPVLMLCDRSVGISWPEATVCRRTFVQIPCFFMTKRTHFLHQGRPRPAKLWGWSAQHGFLAPGAWSALPGASRPWP